MASDEAPDVGEIIKAARRRPHACAIVIGPDGPIIEAHPKKPTEMMRRAAKARGGGPKGAQGVLTVEGKTFMLACEADDVPAALPRIVRRYLADLGHPLKVIFNLPSGANLDDAEDGPPVPGASGLQVGSDAVPAPPLRNDPRAAVAQGPVPPPPPADPKLAAAVSDRLKRAILQARGMPPDRSDRLMRALALVWQRMGLGDLTGADAALAQIEAALAKGSQTPPSPSRTKPPTARPPSDTMQDVPPGHRDRVLALARQAKALAPADPSLARKVASAVLQIVLAFQLGNPQRAEKLIAATDRAVPKPSATAPMTPLSLETQKATQKAANLKKVFSKLPDAMLMEIAAELGTPAAEALLSNPKRRAHFFGQALQEVGQGGAMSEDLHYRVENLTKFKYFKDHPEEAQLYGKTASKKADPEAIANRAYGGRADLGNGDIASGDGWRFRGRGLIQLTGRANYTAFEKWHNATYDEKIDLVSKTGNPDLLVQPKYAVRSALWFFMKNKLFEIADEGVTEDTSNRITKRVNKHTDSYQNRWKNTQDLNAKGALEEEPADLLKVPGLP